MVGSKTFVEKQLQKKDAQKHTIIDFTFDIKLFLNNWNTQQHRKHAEIEFHIKINEKYSILIVGILLTRSWTTFINWKRGTRVDFFF